MKIDGIKKIVSLGSDELSEYDLYNHYYGRGVEKTTKVRADIFVYAYQNDGYEGSGIAVWRRNRKWFYHYLGHCSCDGPTVMIEASDKAAFSLADILATLKKEYNYLGETVKVSDYLQRYYA